MGELMFAQPQDKAEQKRDIEKTLSALETRIYKDKAINNEFVNEVKNLYAQAKKENHQQAIAFCEKALQLSGSPLFSAFAKDAYWITFYDVYFKIISLSATINIPQKGAYNLSKALADLKHGRLRIIEVPFMESQKDTFKKLVQGLQDVVPLEFEIKAMQDGSFIGEVKLSSAPQRIEEKPKQPPSDQQKIDGSQQKIDGRIVIREWQKKSEPQQTQYSDEELAKTNQHILFSSAQREGIISFTVHRQHATHYTHSEKSLSLLKKAFEESILLLAEAIGLKTDGYGTIENFLSANKADLVNFIDKNNVSIYSSATVEIIYAKGQQNWTDVKKELEMNLNVAREYAENFNDYAENYLGKALPITLDLNLLQEIPPNVREMWLSDPSTSPYLKTFLKTQYSDERIKANRLRVFGIVYYDAMEEQKGKTQQEIENLKKDKNSATYAYEKLKEAVDFRLENGRLVDVEIKNPARLNQLLSLRGEKTNPARSNELLSLQSGELRWIDNNGEGSYFDNLIALSDKDGPLSHKLEKYELPPINISNRALGFGMGAAGELSIQIVGLYDKEGNLVQKVEPGKEYLLKLSVLHNQQPPTIGALTVKVYDGIQNGARLEATKGADGYYYATYSVPPVFRSEALQKISFIGEYKIGDFSSGKVVYHHINPPVEEEKKKEETPSKMSPLPPQPIRHVMPNVKQEIPIVIPLFAPSLSNYEMLNNEIQKLVSDFGGRLNEEKGRYEGITLNNEEEVRKFTEGLKQSFRNWVNNTFDKLKGQLKAGTTKEQLLNLIDNNNFEQMANLMVEGSPLKTAFETYRNTIQGTLAAAVVLFDLLKKPSFVVSADAELLDLFQKQDPASHQSLSLHVYVNLATNKIVLSNKDPTRFLSSNEGFYLAYTLQTKGFSLRANAGAGHTGIYTSNLRPLDQFFVFADTNMGFRLTDWLQLNMGVGITQQFAGSSFVEFEQLPINISIDKNSVWDISGGLSWNFGRINVFGGIFYQIYRNNHEVNRNNSELAGRVRISYGQDKYAIEFNMFNNKHIQIGVQIVIR